MSFESAKYPPLHSLSLVQSVKISASWSSDFANEEQYDITARGPLALLARRQQRLSIPIDDEHYMDGSSQIDVAPEQLVNNDTVPQDVLVASPCSTLVSVKLNFARPTMSSLEKPDLSDVLSFEQLDDTERYDDESATESEKDSPSFDPTRSWDRAIHAPTSSGIPEPTTPGLFCTTALDPSARESFLSTLRASRSSLCETLVSQLEGMNVDEVISSSSGLEQGWAHWRNANSPAHEKTIKRSSMQRQHSRPTILRKALISETSTSPFVKKWVYRPKTEPASIYRNTALCSHLPRYLISELYRSGDLYAYSDPTL